MVSSSAFRLGSVSMAAQRRAQGGSSPPGKRPIPPRQGSFGSPLAAKPTEIFNSQKWVRQEGGEMQTGPTPESVPQLIQPPSQMMLHINWVTILGGILILAGFLIAAVSDFQYSASTPSVNSFQEFYQLSGAGNVLMGVGFLSALAGLVIGDRRGEEGTVLMQPAQPHEPPTTMPPWTAPHPGAMTGSSRFGPGLILTGTVLVGIGTLVLAFALGSIGFGNPQTSGTYPNYTVTFSAWSPGFTIGALLIGVGIIMRGLGAFVARPS